MARNEEKISRELILAGCRRDLPVREDREVGAA